MILKNTNYLFVDGRYTLQAKKECGKNFTVLEIPHTWPKDVYKISNLKKLEIFKPEAKNFILNKKKFKKKKFYKKIKRLKRA